ncbi:hypothetical protein [Sphingobacterium deserti]|nr:hypothetical protein [Sphingobacterium deserti]
MTRQEKNQQKHRPGWYEEKYRMDDSISEDSVRVEIVIFNADDSSPIDFQGVHFSLNEYNNKVIKTNRCVAKFAKRDLPHVIYLEAYQLNKVPVRFMTDKKKLQNKNSVYFKAFLVTSVAGNI